MNHQTRIGILSSLLAASMLFAGCTADTGGDEDDEDDVACESDADCKGDRICEQDECVDPNQPAPPPTGTGGTGGSPAEQPVSQTATVVVQNATSTSVWYLYIAPCWSDSWGPDLLGSNVLMGGSAVTVYDIGPDCYDFLAVSQYDTQWREDDVYLSAGQTLTWTLLP